MFGEVLKTNSSLTKLDLSCNVKLFQDYNKFITRNHICAGNSISTGAAEKLSDGLKVNSTLEELNLSGGAFGSE